MKAYVLSVRDVSADMSCLVGVFSSDLLARDALIEDRNTFMWSCGIVDKDISSDDIGIRRNVDVWLPTNNGSKPDLVYKVTVVGMDEVIPEQEQEEI